MRADHQLARPANIERPTMCLRQCWGWGPAVTNLLVVTVTNILSRVLGLGGPQRRDPAWGRGGASELRSDDECRVGVGVAGSRRAFPCGWWCTAASSVVSVCLCVCAAASAWASPSRSPPAWLPPVWHRGPAFCSPHQASLFPVSVGCLLGSVSPTHSRDRGFFTPVSRAEY